MTSDAQSALIEVFPGVRAGGAAGAAPIYEIVAGSADPEELVLADLIVGDGPEAGPGSTVTAHYVGVGLNSGEIFDASWSRGQALQFPLSRVIEGWQDGIPGMRVGGRRVLVIPGDLAYGPFPPPGAKIGPNETLVFIVDLVSVP
jgi:peptidylprolyl isomerase